MLNTSSDIGAGLRKGCFAAVNVIGRTGFLRVGKRLDVSGGT